MTNPESSLENIQIKIVTGGRPYEMMYADFSAWEEMEFKQVTGVDIVSLFMADDPQINSITLAGLVWIFRKRHEKKLSFKEVAQDFRIGDLESMDVIDITEVEEEEAPSPNGSAPVSQSLELSNPEV